MNIVVNILRYKEWMIRYNNNSKYLHHNFLDILKIIHIPTN